MGHNEHFPYAYHSSSPQSASSPASSPPSISPSGSSSPLVPSSPSSSTSSPKLVATFKLPKTCTACGKAIKTQGKVCAKCKMRKYRERKKEQEQSLKVQMKAYRDQEEALKARIRLLEEDLQRRASLDRSSPFAPMSESASKMSEPSERASARHEKLLAQQQEALKQQQEIIAAQQTVIAQQQHIINQHNLGHLLPTSSSSSVPSSRLHPLLDHNSAAAVAALTSLAEDVKPPSRTSSSAFHLPSLLHSALPSMQYSQRSSSLPTRSAPVLPSPAELSAEQRRGPAPAVAASNNRMAITHLLSPSSAEMCPVSCI